MSLNSALSPTVKSSSYSCVRCSQRKVRCDKQDPCSACVKHNVQCLFRAPPPPRRRPKRVKEANLKDKLRRYEALLQQQGLDLNALPDTAQVAQQRPPPNGSELAMDNGQQLPTPLSTATELQQSITTSQLIPGQGGSKYVDNSLWSRMVQEFHDPDEALEESSEEETDIAESDEDVGFVLGVARTPKNGYSHPSTERIHQLWQIFIENIDPLTRVVHVPSLQPMIQKAATDVGRLPRSFEALMFAIYAAAVMSLKDDECKEMFGELRKSLLSHYISATEMALSRAKFMGTNSIIVLQALVLHLLSVRLIYGPRTVWTLTGVASRIAEGMGLHRDGESLGLPPFESEIRRRIWWQLKIHEFRTAELAGLAKLRVFSSDDFTCRSPANINDSELYPEMSSPANSSIRPTDMTFCLMITELNSFAKRHAAKYRQQEKNSDRWEDLVTRGEQSAKDDFVRELEEILEAKYLRYCDPTQPLQHVTMLVARASLNVVRFITHHPRRWASQDQTPEAEREEIWRVSVSLLEQYDIMQSDRRLRGFSWCSAYFLPWHAFIHILDTVRARPLMMDAAKVWRLIEATYANNPDMVSSTKKPIYVAVGNLCLNAFHAHEAALMHEGRSIAREPEYVTKLSQQREAARARRQARDVTGTHEARAAGGSRPLPPVVGVVTRPNLGASRSSGAFDTYYEQHQEDRYLNQASNDNDPFWLTSGLDNGLYGGDTGEMINMDPDFMLAQEYYLDDASGPSNISWTQWDALLGELNLPPNVQ